MARNEISFNDSVFVFETVMRVRNTEVDAGQHISVEAMTSLLTEAKAWFFYSKGIKTINADYQGLIVQDLALNFISRVRAREELLFEVGVDRLNEETGTMFIKVTRMYDGSLVAKSQIEFVNYDYRVNKVLPISGSVKEVLDQQPFEL